MASNLPLLARLRTPDLPRRTAQQVEEARGRGIESAARVHAAGYVAHAGQMIVAAHTAEESNLIQAVPLAEPRLKAVGDALAAVVSAEVMGMAW